MQGRNIGCIEEPVGIVQLLQRFEVEVHERDLRQQARLDFTCPGCQRQVTLDAGNLFARLRSPDLDLEALAHDFV